MPPTETTTSQDGEALPAALEIPAEDTAKADSTMLATAGSQAAEPEEQLIEALTENEVPPVTPKAQDQAADAEAVAPQAPVVVGPTEPKTESPAPKQQPSTPAAPTEQGKTPDKDAAPAVPSTPAKPVTVISPEPSKVLLKEDAEAAAPKPQPAPAPEPKPATPAPTTPAPTTPAPATPLELVAPAGKFVEMAPAPAAKKDVVERSTISCTDGTNTASAECDLARRLPAEKPVANMFVLKWDADKDNKSTEESLEMTVPEGQKLKNFQLLLAPPSLASGAKATDSLTLELRDENGKTETVLLNTPQLKAEAAAGRMEPLAYPVRPSEVAPSLGPIKSITFLPGAKSEDDLDDSGELNVNTNVYHDAFDGTPQVGTVLAGLVALPDSEQVVPEPPSTNPANPGVDVQASGGTTGAAGFVSAARPAVQRPATPQDFAPRPQLAIPAQDGVQPRAEKLGGEPVTAPEQDPTLDAMNFTPAALEPSLVALLQAAGISLALIGSVALISAEERRRRA